MDPDPCRLAQFEIFPEIGGTLVGRPAAEVVSSPGGELDPLELGPCGLGLGPRHEQQRVHDLLEPDGLAVDVFESAPVFVGGPIAAECDLDLAERGRQGSPQLVRGIAGEPTLPLQRLMEALEQAVERAGQSVQLVAGPRAGESLVPIGGAHGAGGLGHASHRQEGPAAETTAHERGQEPDDRGETDQGQRHAAEAGLHRLGQRPRSHDQRG